MEGTAGEILLVVDGGYLAMMNTSQKIFNYIRERIIRGDYEIGSFLDAKQISDELVVSPAPIREAFVRLSERGLLDWKRNRGFQVSAISAEDAASSLELLRILCRSAIIRRYDINHLKEFTNVETPEVFSFEHVIMLFRTCVFTQHELEIGHFLWDRIWKIREAHLSSAEMHTKTLESIIEIKHAACEQNCEKIGEIVDSIFWYYEEHIGLLRDYVDPPFST